MSLPKDFAFTDYQPYDFANRRHIGPSPKEMEAMLKVIGYDSLDALIDDTVPKSIRQAKPLEWGAPMTEREALDKLRETANRNKKLVSLIGQGYYGTITPPVIQRNILENPAWYTAYTPYQPEISQGRLEALLNYQTMVCDLTGLDVANASLLDEATAAAEAMAMAERVAKSKAKAFFVDESCHPQTIALLKTRSEPLGWQIIVGDPFTDLDPVDVFGAIFQYPGTYGHVSDFSGLIARLHQTGAIAVIAADPLALALLKSPGDMDADIAVGSTQRFGVPVGYGGPHAAYMAVKDAYKRSMPGRLVGVSIDARGNRAYRLSLQTREQHIRREKATSNICTAQVLLAVMASMYAVFHGPQGLKAISQSVHQKTVCLAKGLEKLGHAPHRVARRAARAVRRVLQAGQHPADRGDVPRAHRVPHRAQVGLRVRERRRDLRPAPREPHPREHDDDQHDDERQQHAPPPPPPARRGCRTGGVGLFGARLVGAGLAENRHVRALVGGDGLSPRTLLHVSPLGHPAPVPTSPAGAHPAAARPAPPRLGVRSDTRQQGSSRFTRFGADRSEHGVTHRSPAGDLLVTGPRHDARDTRRRRTVTARTQVPATHTRTARSRCSRSPAPRLPPASRSRCRRRPSTVP